MKNLCVAGGLLVCTLTSIHVVAQQAEPQFRQVAPSKPALFARFSARTECNSKEVQRLCSARMADAISIQLNNEITLTGEVTDRLQHSDSISTINLRVAEYDGALLNITIHTLPNKTTRISGRLIHPQSGEILILTEENNRYYLVKEQRKFFMAE